MIQELEKVYKKGIKKRIKRTQYVFDEDSNLTRKVLPNGDEIRYSYDKARRVVKEELLK
ncbi:MAG: RHS repeat protein [Lachnospiraceae bacterium]|nr:RHS repeat protein [Lachnospiraceae bacterium]